MSQKALLIYDGECPMCLRARDWATRRISPEHLETMPCQDESRPRRAPMVSREACMEAMQLLFPDGRLYTGEKAFPHLVRMTPFGRWYAWLFYLPGTGLVYRLIARNRLMISSFFVKKSAGESCSREKGCD